MAAVVLAAMCSLTGQAGEAAATDAGNFIFQFNCFLLAHKQCVSPFLCSGGLTHILTDYNHVQAAACAEVS